MKVIQSKFSILGCRFTCIEGLNAPEVTLDRLVNEPIEKFTTKSKLAHSIID